MSMTEWVPGIVNALRKETSKVEQFYNHRLAVNQQKEARLYEMYGMQEDDSNDARYAHGDPRELAHLGESVFELIEDMGELEHFVELNRDGIRRLHHKIRWSHSSQDIGELPNLEFVNLLLYPQYLRRYRQKEERLSTFYAESRRSSLHTSLSLESFCLQFYPPVDEVYRAIASNNESLLSQTLVRVSNRSTGTTKLGSLVFAMLRCAILLGSSNCINILLMKAQSLEGAARSQSESLVDLFRLVVTLVLHSTTSETEHQQADSTKSSELDNKYFDILKIFLEYGQDQAPLSFFKAFDAIICRDIDNDTPLHLAVVAGSSEVTDILLCHCATQAAYNDNSILSSRLQSVLEELLPLAIRSDRPKGFQLLLEHIASINYVADPSRESVLYIASKFGSEDMVRMLLTTAFHPEIDTEVSER